MASDLKVTFRLSGAKEFEKMLLGLGKVPAGRIGTNAVKAGAQVFARKMRENIRAHGLMRPGQRMLRSIKVQSDTELARAGIGIRQAYAGSTLFYAKFSEFGTFRQAPKPWARPAVDEGAQEALGALGLALGRGIEQEAAKLALTLNQAIAKARAQGRGVS